MPPLTFKTNNESLHGLNKILDCNPRPVFHRVILGGCLLFEIRAISTSIGTNRKEIFRFQILHIQYKIPHNEWHSDIILTIISGESYSDDGRFGPDLFFI
jgi:hypothetical protein